jgi:hypothetical protein
VTYTLTGSVCGTVAAGFEDPLTGGLLRLYRPPAERVGEQTSTTGERDRDPQGSTDGGRDGPSEGAERDRAATVASAATTRPRRDGFAVLNPEAVETKADRLLAETTLERGGTFEVVVGEAADGAYEGGPVQVDVRLDELPDDEFEAAADSDPVQFTVGAVMPDWTDAEEGASVATWHHCLTAKQWCSIRALFGAWTVCGTVTDDFGQAVTGATVRAFDADIVQDDLVGSATTDAAGDYRIDYREPGFETTPSPWPPIELEHGPDLYFAVEQGGDLRLNEDRSAGRQPGREDAGYCERIDLTVPVVRIPTPTLWTGIGDTFTIPSGPTDLNDLDAEGYMGAGKYALSGTAAMSGTISEAQFMDRSAPGDTDSIQFRFAVFDTTGRALQNTDPTPSDLQDAANGQLVTGRLFEGVDIGTIRYFPSGGEVSFDVPLAERHVGTDGWVDVRRVVDDAFSRSSVGTGPATDLEDALKNHGPVYYDDSDPLIGINTNAVTAASTPTSSPGDIDDPLADGTTPVETMAVRFEVRQPGSASADRGRTVNAIVVNNTGTFRELEVFDSSGSAVTCQGQSGQMTLEFNAYHPHLREADITVEPNDGAAESIAPPDATNPPNEVIPGKNTDPTVESVSGSFDITKKLDHTCAYTVELHTQRRLHNGDHFVGNDGHVEEVFYYEDT